MDKDKIIDYVISEWAMRSHDGLASGYSNISNINILSDILVENKVSIEEVDEVLESLFGEAKRKSEDYKYLLAGKDKDGNVTHLVSYGHPDQETYPDGEVYTGPHELPINQYKVANKDNIAQYRAASEKDPFFKDLRDVKKISLDNVTRIKEIFSAYPNKEATNLYKSLADTITDIQEAIDIYEGKKYDILQGIINRMDNTKFSGAGRGEIPFVILLKGATSGGNREVDILFGESEIEVKEVQSNAIKISAPTLQGFTKSEFNIAVYELALAATKIKNLQEFLIKVLTDDGELYEKVNDPQREKHVEDINKFFKDPKVGELTYTFLDAIFIISTKILNKVKTTRKPKATIDIDLGEKHKELKVPEKAIPDLQSQLSGITQASGPSRLNIPVSQTEEDTDEKIEEQVMKLSFFKENWDQARVQKEIVDNLIVKQYSQLLIINKAKGNNAMLFGSGTISKLQFYGVGFGKIHLLMPGAAKGGAMTSGD